MAVEPGHYDGRPQALVKHTFLNEYLPALVNKVCSFKNCFVYVDGFAGPWQSADEETFADTSFGIALKAMSDAQIFWGAKGREVRMVAHLVEKDPGASAKLQKLKEQFPKIEIQTYLGDFHAHLPTILARLQNNGFCFSFIDPKGVSLDLALLRPLLERPSSEVLVNFMFDFVNRFVSHPNLNVIETMDKLIPGTDWRAVLDVAKATGAPPEAREEILVEAFRAALRKTGNYRFVTSLVVQKPLADRTLYHLVFGTRNPEGLSVFRDSQVKALKAQADVRASIKSKAKIEKSGQDDFFGGAYSPTLDPSSQQIAEGKAGGIAYAKHVIMESPAGIRWSLLWPTVLEKFTIRRSELGSAMNDLRKSGVICAPGWPSEQKRQPQDQQLFTAFET